MSLSFVYTSIAIIVIAAGFDWALMRWLKGIQQVEANSPRVLVMGVESPVLTWLKYGRLSAFQWPAIDWARVRARLTPLGEIAAIGLWAMYVGQAYLDFDSKRWPAGQDFVLNVQGYFPWVLLKQCGACVFWNGTLDGGAPTLSQLLPAIAHPFILIAISIWGVINGLKATVVIALAVAGLAQWWLAKVMRLGRAARLWGAAMAVVGGHLAGRMENGLIEVIFSAACCSLVIPPALKLALTGQRRAAVLFGLTLGLALLAGQGYMQIGFLLSVLPAFLVLLIDGQFRLRPVWKEFVLAGILALLLAAVLLIPFLHFFPNFSKPDDPEFNTAQPIEYQPLNLVVRDPAFYGLEVLGKIPWPHLYVDYIGWVPVLLTLLAFRLIPRSEIRLLAFFILAIMLVYLTSSALLLKLAHSILPGPLASLIAGMRFPSEISSLAVPLILGLAAWGLDLLLKLNWPRLTLSLPSGLAVGLSIAWLALALPLVWSVRAAYDFGQEWLKVIVVPADYYRIIPQIKPAASEWVGAPFADWTFATIALEQGFKVTNAYRPWEWRGRELAPPSLETTRDNVDPSTPNYRGQIEYLNLIDHPETSYASVDTGTQKVPCHAVALGGNIDVDCQTDGPGLLTVYENRWSGWTAARDGIASALGEGQWLITAAPAGSHHYSFRYRPWDVAIGLGLTLFGLVLAARLWLSPPLAPAETANPT